MLKRTFRKNDRTKNAPVECIDLYADSEGVLSTMDEMGIHSAIGAQTLERVSRSISFDTPDLVIGSLGTAPFGILLTTLNEGDILLTGRGREGPDINSYLPIPTLFVTTAWDGTTPGGIGAFVVSDDASSNTQLAYQDLTVGAISVISSKLVTQPVSDVPFGEFSVLCTSGSIDLYFGVNDQGGGDPGSMQGAGVITLLILRAT